MVYLLLLLVPGAAVIGLLVGWHLGQRAAAEGHERQREELATTVDLALDAVRAERGEAMQATLDTVLSVATSKLGDQLEAGKIVIDGERGEVAHQVEGVQHELRRVSQLVADLQKERAEQNGQLANGLEQAFKVTATLADSTRSLERALASSQARGQWGERMAEDVLRSAGFAEGINYSKQTKLANGRIPDYTFALPTGHVVHMDVKFPIDNYLRWLQAAEADKATLAKAFQRDVRQRIKELTERDYVDVESTVDYVLMFVPNESVYGFLHEHDADLIDYALAQKVVLCSPTTLFAVLAVIRQAVENFMMDRKGDEILGALAALRVQWQRWTEPMDKMRRGLLSAQKAFDELHGPRTREFEKHLQKLEAVRDSREREHSGGETERCDGDRYEEEAAQMTLRQVV